MMLTDPESLNTLRVEARFKNARLYHAICQRSEPLSDDARALAQWYRGPIRSFCRLYDFQPVAVYALLNLRMTPTCATPARAERTRVRGICLRLASVLGHDVTWLFPSDLYRVQWPKSFAVEMPHERLLPLTGAPRALLMVPPTQEQTMLTDERRVQLRDVLVRVLHTLTPREEQVLKWRFGIGDSVEWSLRGIGNELNLGGERVRQVEAKALRKLRHPSRSAQLRRFLAP